MHFSKCILSLNEAWLCVCVCVYVYIYIYMYVCLFTYFQVWVLYITFYSSVIYSVWNKCSVNSWKLECFASKYLNCISHILLVWCTQVHSEYVGGGSQHIETFHVIPSFSHSWDTFNLHACWKFAHVWGGYKCGKVNGIFIIEETTWWILICIDYWLRV
jgi:hypothetical protein